MGTVDGVGVLAQAEDAGRLDAFCELGVDNGANCGRDLPNRPG